MAAVGGGNKGEPAPQHLRQVRRSSFDWPRHTPLEQFRYRGGRNTKANTEILDVIQNDAAGVDEIRRANTEILDFIQNDASERGGKMKSNYRDSGLRPE